MRSTDVHSRIGWQAQFALLAAIWGSSFLFIKVLAEHASAVWVAFGRIGLGALTLLVILGVRRERLPSGGRVWLHCAAAAVVFNDAPWVLLAYGEQHTSSIVAGLWNATTPLWVLVLSLVAFSEQRPARVQAVGLAVGFIGVAVLLGPWRGPGGGPLIGQLAFGGAAFCYGIGFNYTRRHLSGRPESGIAMSATQLICATVILAPFLPLAPLPSTHVRLDVPASLLALGTLASGVAYVLNYSIIRARGATVASTVTYVIPIVSTGLGAAVLSEQLHWNQPLGAAVLLAGIAISQPGRAAIYRAIRRLPSRSPARARPGRAGS